MSDPGKEAPGNQNNAGPQDPGIRRQRVILIVAATISVIVATAAGYYLWDAIVLGLLAALAWSKQLLTFQGLILLLKKLGIILLLGSKKLLFTLIGRFLMLAAHTRLPVVRRFMVGLQWWARKTKRSLRGQWGCLSPLDKFLAVIGSVPLVLSISLVMIVYLLPKSLWSYLISRIEMSSGATVLSKTLPKTAQEKLQKTHDKAKMLVKKHLKPGTNSAEPEDTEKQ